MSTIFGLTKFQEWFKGYDEHYVLIGGTACSILMSDMGLDFRATKDFDIVLLIDIVDTKFFNHFWSFIECGEYNSFNSNTGNQHFYRFDKPKTIGYPKIIELFCRETFNLDTNRVTHITPIHIDQTIKSLSAIVLDNDYYQLLKENRTVVNGISVLNIEIIIILKIKAWLDLTLLKFNGVHIHSDEINKHKKDIFVLFKTLESNKKVNSLNENIKNDIQRFVIEIKKEIHFNDIEQKDIIVNFTLFIEQVFLQ